MQTMTYATRLVCMAVLLIAFLPKSTPAAMIQLFGTGDPTPPMFNTNPLPPNPSIPGLDFSNINLNDQYNLLFGAPSPNKLPTLLWGESQETAFMGLTSDGDVNTFQTFNFLITGDYWRVRTDLTFNPSTAIIIDPNDELTMTGFVQHTGKLSAPGIPHPGDSAAGPIIEYDMLINAGNKIQVPNPFGFTTFAVADNFAAVNTHPNVDHQDIILGILAANVEPDTNAQISFRDEIEGFWTGAVIGSHAVPEPSTILLFGSGLFAAGMRRRKIET